MATAVSPHPVPLVALRLKFDTGAQAQGFPYVGRVEGTVVEQISCIDRGDEIGAGEMKNNALQDLNGVKSF
jgi:hypothetical protein